MVSVSVYSGDRYWMKSAMVIGKFTDTFNEFLRNFRKGGTQ